MVASCLSGFMGVRPAMRLVKRLRSLTELEGYTLAGNLNFSEWLFQVQPMLNDVRKEVSDLSMRRKTVLTQNQFWEMLSCDDRHWEDFGGRTYIRTRSL